MKPERITQDARGASYAAWSVHRYWVAANDQRYKVPSWWSGWSLQDTVTVVCAVAMLYAVGRMLWAFGRVFVAMWGAL